MTYLQDWSNFALHRPNYFPGQYLLDEDFELAHRYLNDRQRYINSRLHLAGIVEGLEVEAIAGKAEVIIKPGTAIDGEGHLIILTEATTRLINAQGWLCLRYHEEPKLLQQPEIPDSFTRFVEAPLLTLEAIETRDVKTVVLAKLTPGQDRVAIDTSVRQYSGVRLPNGSQGDVGLQTQDGVLAIQGNLTLDGVLKLGGHSTLASISEAIDRNSDRSDVVPSEKAVKAHIEDRIMERLAAINVPTQEKPTISLTTQADGKLYGWKTEGAEGSDPSALIKLIASRASVETPRLVIQRDTGNIGIGTLEPARLVDVNGTLRALHLESTNPMRHRMYPADPLVYQDIFDAVKAKAIQKRGQPAGYNDTRHATEATAWNDRRLICFGEKVTGDAGALVKVPEGYDTLWVRVAGDMHISIRAKFIDGAKEDLGYWSGGRRSANCYCPDGSLSDGHARFHQWVPIPVGRSGQVLLIDEIGSTSVAGLWFSGLAFSHNPWGHAVHSAQSFYWTSNGGKATTWAQDSDDWNGDVYTKLEPKTNQELMVPYRWTGRDKLLYLVEHNNNWNGCMHTGITINGTPLGERFLASYDNPFARHWNSKIYNRYIAARIPAELIPQPTADTPPLLKVQIDLTKQNPANDPGIYFREMGTHDLEVPISP